MPNRHLNVLCAAIDDYNTPLLGEAAPRPRLTRYPSSEALTHLHF